METDASKEIRITFKKGQLMKEHKTSYPIVVEVFKGRLDFGVLGTKQHLIAGQLIALEGGVPHDLLALEESVVRLSLSKQDSIDRVKSIETS
jgi:quercetin dioxygenase-like cupin family protein